MSSLRKIESARANGARSHGPVTAEGKQRSAQNAMRHGLLARCVVLDNEAREGFDALFELHLDRLQPADGVEFGFIEEMVSSYWRMRRAWAIETRLLQKRLDDQPGADELSRLAGAFENLAASQSIGLIHRYDTRLNCMYQRALKNLLLLRKAGMPNEPNPISGHSEGGPGEVPTGSPQPPAPPEMPNDPNPISEHLHGGPGAQPAPSLMPQTFPNIGDAAELVGQTPISAKIIMNLYSSSHSSVCGAPRSIRRRVDSNRQGFGGGAGLVRWLAGCRAAES